MSFIYPCCVKCRATVPVNLQKNQPWIFICINCRAYNDLHQISTDCPMSNSNLPNRPANPVNTARALKLVSRYMENVNTGTTIKNINEKKMKCFCCGFIIKETCICGFNRHR